MISKQTRTIIKRVFWVFIPSVLVLAVGIAALNLYLIHRLAHPPVTQLYSTPRDFQIILQKPMWFDEKWRNSDSTQSVGWFLAREKPGPTLILSHGYGANRSELLTLSFELWKAGYHVLVYDLRGHGESPVKWSGLGTYEKDDLLSAIKFVRERKTESGQSLFDGRVGLYGVDLGGYISLAAAVQDPMVKAVAVDSVYPDVDHFIKARLKSSVGTNSLGNRLVESSWTSFLTGLAVQVYLMRNEDSVPAVEAVSANGGRQLLFITAKDTGVYDQTTRELYALAKGQKQLVEVAHSRMDRLYEKDATDYDARVVAFFQQALPLAADKAVLARKK